MLVYTLTSQVLTAVIVAVALAVGFIARQIILGKPVTQAIAGAVEQRDLLMAAGCSHAQGFLYAKPMDAACFEQWMLEHEAAQTTTALETA